MERYEGGSMERYEVQCNTGYMLKPYSQGDLVLYSEAMEEMRNLIDTYDLLIKRKNEGIDLLKESIECQTELLKEEWEDNTALRDEIARLAKERDLAREKWKSAIARYPNGANGCCSLTPEQRAELEKANKKNFDFFGVPLTRS